MNALPASASRTASASASSEGPILICGVNWLGDSVMTMPALRAFRAAHPAVPLAMLVKPPMGPLWRLDPGAGEVVALDEGFAGVWRAARDASVRECAAAYVLPNSFRAALVPFAAGIPLRVGYAGHWRRSLLTRVVAPRVEPGREHQAYEYFDLLGVPASADSLKAPFLSIPADLRDRCRRLMASELQAAGAGLDSERLVALMPGATRGPSKRWPAECFADVGRRLVAEAGVGLVLLGGMAERDLCAGIAGQIPRRCANLAGRTGLEEFAGILSLCAVAAGNDSGGSHLAAAVGCRVVAIFGLTDPAKTAPLGIGHRVVTAEGARGARDIRADSAEAVAALRSIGPARVYREIRELLE